MLNLITSPMLATTFVYHLPRGQLFSQPKLDGVRCIADAAGLWSRNGRKITSCEHLERALCPYFDRYPAAVFDGELYDQSLCTDLAGIISLVNTRVPTPEKKTLCESLIQLHVFDLPSHPGRFGERWTALTSMRQELSATDSGNLICFVDNTTIRNSNELDQLYATYLQAGYEGQMIRADAPYEPGRSTLLLKRKPFHDAEFDLVRLDEVGRTHSGYAKRAILRMPDGRTFGAGIKGSHAFAANLLNRKYSSATVRYSNTTSSGLPRSPVAVAFHENERL